MVVFSCVHLTDMNNFCTPQLGMTSSVFLTPPSSEEKDCDHDQLLLSPVSPLPVFSLLTPRKEVEDTIDFISTLYPSFCHLSNEIISYLSPPDLCNSITVCKKWREVVLTNYHCVQLIEEYRKERKINQENRDTIKKLPLAILQRTILSSLSVNFIPPKRNDIKQSHRGLNCSRALSPTKRCVTDDSIVCGKRNKKRLKRL